MPYEVLDSGAAPAPGGRYEVLDAPQPSMLGSVMDSIKADIASTPQRFGNAVAGAVRGAGSIGATLMAPMDIVRDAAAGRGLSLHTNMERRADMDAALQGLGADPNSGQYRVGKLAGEFAGTAGAGSLLAGGVRMLPFAGPTADAIATGLESGGFNASGMTGIRGAALRAGTGAAVGGASAGLVDPQSAGTGAAIGGIVPGASQLAVKGAQGIGNAYRALTTPQDVRIAQDLASKLGVTREALTAATTGPHMIPGYVPTVPQIVQNPVASQLQRTIQTAGGQDIADAVATQQGQYRDALGRIAPIANTVQDAANRAGSAIQGYAVPAEQQARQNVSSLFQAIPDSQATMQLPLQQMQNAQTRFLGPGTFGKGGAAAEDAMRTATHIGMDASTLTPQVVPFSQIQALRSSIGEAITQAQAKGQSQAAAALTSMKNSIDNKVGEVVSGIRQPGEVFTPEAVDAWGQALNAHAGKRAQFNTGPQVGMFRLGADGQPAIQGAEIPGKFFNGNRSQVEDGQAFRRLIGNRDDLAQELKSYALTEGAKTASAAGNLGDGFINWAESRSGAIGQLFNDQERATIRQVGKAVQRSMAAENLGRVSGPDTAQKLASLQSNGLLDSKAVDMIGRRIPILGHFTGPALDVLRKSAAQTRNGIMGGLLADPGKFADTLGRAPGLLNFAPEQLGLLSRGASRVVPLLGTE